MIYFQSVDNADVQRNEFRETEQLTDNIFNAKKIDWIEIYIMYFVPDYILYIGTLCYVNAEI